MDILITGCEVSLWVGEAFASDLHRVFPKLKVVTVSANKLLGLLGQSPLPLPATGFQLNEHTYSFRKSSVLLISQSGSTFATLGCAHLLRAFTPHIFSVTSHWDTQLARLVRAGQNNKVMRWSITFSSYTFVMHTAHSSAEPCSLTVAATHQLLTQLLIVLTHYTHASAERGSLTSPKTAVPCRGGGSNFYQEEVAELSRLNEASLQAVAEIVGEQHPTAAQLRRQGRLWALYILEAPLSWLFSAAYILGTVVAQATPLSALVYALAPSVTPDGCDAEPATWLKSATGAVDVRLFLPLM